MEFFRRTIEFNFPHDCGDINGNMKRGRLLLAASSPVEPTTTTSKALEDADLVATMLIVGKMVDDRFSISSSL